MSEATRDGRHVFPNLGDGEAYDGMTLRDWYAGQIAPSVVSTKQVDPNYNGIMRRPPAPPPKMEFDPEETARKAYAFADAMLAEKGKRR